MRLLGRSYTRFRLRLNVTTFFSLCDGVAVLKTRWTPSNRQPYRLRLLRQRVNLAPEISSKTFSSAYLCVPMTLTLVGFSDPDRFAFICFVWCTLHNETNSQQYCWYRAIRVCRKLLSNCMTIWRSKNGSRARVNGETIDHWNPNRIPNSE